MSYRRSSYQNDPRWIEARFNSKCACGAEIKKGDKIFYYPSSKQALCPACSQTAAGQFESERQDEDMYNSQYGGY